MLEILSACEYIILLFLTPYLQHRCARAYTARVHAPLCIHMHVHKYMYICVDTKRCMYLFTYMLTHMNVCEMVCFHLQSLEHLSARQQAIIFC